MDSKNQNDQSTPEEERKKEDERVFFDGEHYYTKEEFFNPDDEEEDPKPKKNKKGFKIVIASVLTLALFSNVFAIWPKLINLPALEFLATSQELSQNEDVQTYTDSVVVVRGGNSKGTGFLFTDEGHIMTNQHVIEDEPFVTVSFQNGDGYHAEVIESDEELDIAILKVEEVELDRHVLEFEDAWDIDEPVYVIGNPLFFNYIANEGQLLGETTTQNREDPVLMLDAPVYRGSSGSPVINEQGNVVGVIFATTQVDHEGNEQKVGLAVPVEDFIEDLSVGEN
ncbi:S1C family serine protease [Salipaludibacillus neizhouensis]|nr:trypsin-like peptidase domain-containing protein [Salipaludibacillus neizhouensis]